MLPTARWVLKFATFALFEQLVPRFFKLFRNLADVTDPALHPRPRPPSSVPMERWSGKVALVTGSSAGIGASIATKLVEAGLQVVGLARRLDKLQDLSTKLQNLPGKFHPVQADITVEADVVKAITWTKSNLGGLHVLVNNAGVTKPATLLDGSTQIFKEVLDTNVLALTVVTREAVKVMREGDEGHVIHINSGAGHRVKDVPLLNVYFASKFAVTALAESLRYDLQRVGSRIRVTSLSPGLVETDIFKDYLAIENLGKILEEAPKLTPEDVANAVVYVLGTPPHLQVTELRMTPTGTF